MDTRKLDEGTRLVGGVSWSAIATGAVIAVALQTVLVLLGVAIASSVGDRAPEGGYAVWVVLVQIVALAVGAALTARLSHAERRMNGVAAGVMTWAVSLVIGGAASAFVMGAQLNRGAWSAFFGALIGLGAAIVGGSFGATIGRSTAAPLAGPPIAHTS
jgi:hypothetical protein